MDARLYQIIFLAALLTTGVLLRDFALRPEQMALTFAAGLATQALCIRALGLKRVGYLSAAITCFGLSILLRADTSWVHPLAACIAIGSKFVLRINGKHLYNPANFGVMTSVLLLPGAWISPGQWGTDLALAGWFVVLGALVTQRARRWDISWMFLTAFLGLIAARVLWLGQNPAVFAHQLGNGGLLLFAFFMISDPKTTPDSRAARFLFAGLVALGACYVHFVLFRTNGLLWSLAACSPLVPVLDRLLPGPRYAWPGTARASVELRHETFTLDPVGSRPRAVVH